MGDSRPPVPKRRRLGGHEGGIRKLAATADGVASSCVATGAVQSVWDRLAAQGGRHRFGPAADAGGHRLLGGDAAGCRPLGGGVDGVGGFQGLDPLGQFGNGTVVPGSGVACDSPALSWSRKPVSSAR